MIARDTFEIVHDKIGDGRRSRRVLDRQRPSHKFSLRFTQLC